MLVRSMSSLAATEVAPPPVDTRAAGRRLAGVALLGAFAVALLLAVPGLRPVLRPVGDMSPGWLSVAVALELASCLSFVVVFRLFFDRLPARDARSLAWTSMASGALLPGGGVGGLAIGGWVMRLTGVPTSWIVRRSSGLFFLTSAASVAAVIGAGVMLLLEARDAGDAFRAGLPVVIASAAVLLVLALPALSERWGANRRSVREIVDGVRDARGALARPSWRLLGAAGYLGFDIAVLWATLSALGAPPTASALVMGYTIGYLANTLLVPGGLGVLDGGLAAALVLYHVPAAHIAAAVVVYHAIALWLPGIGGLLAYASLRRRLGP
jgi:uncharacterized membrane protein YbhN (UPF0104 family)